MDIDTIVSTMLNGEPIHDGLVIAIILVCFKTFYECIFSGMFSIFSKN